MEQINQRTMHSRFNKEASLNSHQEFCLILQDQTGYSTVATVVSNISFVSSRANLCLIICNSFVLT